MAASLETSLETWAEVRRCFETSAEPVAAIAARFGVSTGQIYRRRKREGWRDRGRNEKSGTRKSKVSTKPGRKQSPARATAAGQRDALVGRFFRAISAKLGEWERRMECGDLPEEGERERLMKELNTMIQSFEKVADVAAVAEKQNDRSDRRPELATAAETSRMRREIAERLERLVEGGVAGAASGAAEPDRDRGSEA